MILIDSHCHLDMYDQEIDQVIQRAYKQGIKVMISICTSLTNFEKVLTIAERYPYVYASMGLHPTEAHDMDPTQIYDWLVQGAQHPKVIGFGETGLDLMPKSPPLEVQKMIFHAHIKAALAVDLPLIVHMRQAEEDFLSLMGEYEAPFPKGVLHCFTGSFPCAEKAISWGWKISISGIITFPNAKDLVKVVQKIPLTSLLVETDAPWLAPQSYRGQRNEPAYIIETASKLAQLHQTSLEDLAKQTTDNFFTLFPKASNFS